MKASIKSLIARFKTYRESREARRLLNYQLNWLERVQRQNIRDARIPVRRGR